MAIFSGREAEFRSLSRRGLRFDRLPLQPLQHRFRAATLGSKNRERNRSQHESYGRPCGRLGEGTGSPTRTESSLTALPAKRRRNVAALAALQEYDDDDEKADDNVNRYYQTVEHEFVFFPNRILRFSEFDLAVARVPRPPSRRLGAEGGI